MDNMENEIIETVEVEYVSETPKKKGKVLDILALIFGVLAAAFCALHLFSFIIGFIPFLSLLTYFTCCTDLLAPVFAIAAIILAIVAPKGVNGKRSGMAKAGLICGIISLVLLVIAFVISILAAIGLVGLVGMTESGALEEILEEILGSSYNDSYYYY